jgi:hypothetical protein
MPLIELATESATQACRCSTLPHEQQTLGPAMLAWVPHTVCDEMGEAETYNSAQPQHSCAVGHINRLNLKSSL